MNILIADDDLVSRRVLRAALLNLGHDVVEVEDGVKAIEALSRPDAPSLAIVDWMMPGVDGIAVCQTVRQNPGRYVYVILLTSKDAPTDMIEALDAGADDFLTKPFNVGELRARLKAGERVLALQDDLLRSQEVLKHEATHDQLTGLWNRGRILDELGRELRRNRRESTTLAVVMADVDHFKRVNDSHGHAVGDTRAESCWSAHPVDAASVGFDRPVWGRGVSVAPPARRRQWRPGRGGARASLNCGSADRPIAGATARHHEPGSGVLRSVRNRRRGVSRGGG